MRLALVVVTFGLATLMPVCGQEFAGEYSCQVPEVASGLLLRPDRTFEYFFTYGAADYSAKGTWRNDAQGVYLTTSAGDKAPFRVVRSGRGEASTLRVFVQAANGRGVAHLEVELTGSDEPLSARTSEEGLASFPAKGARRSVRVHVPVYEIDAGPFILEAGQNDLWLEIDGEAITQLKFRDERLRLVDGSLEMTFWKGGKPILYRKR